LARLVKRCQDLPGEELFQYIDESGEPHTVCSEDVNEYLRAISGNDFTAKDFRTWAGSVLAARFLRDMLAANPATRTKSNVVRAVERVARQLGNTPSVCRKCYIHPAVIEAYLDGSMSASYPQPDDAAVHDIAELAPEEATVVVLLRRRLAGTNNRSAL
jgi:DNA topoisomerase I